MTQAPTAPTAAPPPVAAPIPQARQGSLLLASGTLWRREMVRFFRQPNRVVSAALTPLIFWIFLGSGLNRAMTLPSAAPASGQPGVGYMEYFFPGTISLVLMFTAIFSTVSVIEDRREGFLQGVLVAPISRLAIALGKILGGASIAMIQGMLFLGLWLLMGHWPGASWILLTLAIMAAMAVGLTGLGLCIAWPMDSTAGFHAVMMLFLMPMWFLSGAVFPASATTPLWMRLLMWANPLTYGQSALTEAMTTGRATAGAPVGLGPATLVTFAASAAMVLLATYLVSRPRRDGTL